MPRPVAVIQLAFTTKTGAVRCCLLHIAYAGITLSLSEILCSPVSLEFATSLKLEPVSSITEH